MAGVNRSRPARSDRKAGAWSHAHPRHRTRKEAMKLSNRGWIALSGTQVGLGAAALAGPLDPPAGPVTGTYKTLQQVEPRIDVATLPGSETCAHIIWQPGSYYLSGNLSV